MANLATLLYIILCKACIFAVFLLTLQTDFAARWCFCFSANELLIEQVCRRLSIRVLRGAG